MSELQQVLIVDSNLELVLFSHYDHVKVGIGHEGKVRAMSLLCSPTTALAGISEDDVKVPAHPEAYVTMQGDVTSVIGTAHQVNGESFCIWIWNSADENHFPRENASRNRCCKWHRRVINWLRGSSWVSPGRITPGRVISSSWRRWCRHGSTVGLAVCSIKPDAVDLNTALYRQSVHVMFLDSVAEVAKMSTVHGNLVMMVLTKYGDFKGHPPLEGLVAASLLPSPAMVLVAVPDHTVVVQSGVEVEGSVGAGVDVGSSL